MSGGAHNNSRGERKKTWTAALWGTLFIVFLYPFWCLGLNRAFGWDAGELYTFGLELKDFITAWIALGGIVGVTLNIFLTRTRITKQEEQFNKQYGKQVEQIEVQQRQLQEQEKQRRDARFASGVELLGNTHESTRIGGAYNLYFLARDFEEYREPVCEILCVHLREIAAKDKFEVDDDMLPTEEAQKKYPKNEVQSVVDLLFRKFEQVKEPKEGQGSEASIFLDYHKDLSDVFLFEIKFFRHKKEFTPEIKQVDFSITKFTDVHFGGAKLTDVVFKEAEFTGYYTSFESANLTRVDFLMAKLLTRANFLIAKLTNVYFVEAELTNFNFEGAELINVSFSNGKLKGGYFSGTKLQGYSLEEIVEGGRSMELTAEKDAATVEETS